LSALFSSQGEEAAVSNTPPDQLFINALRTIFGKRTMIFGEDPARYDQLLILVAADVKPRTMREWLVVKDIVDAQWEFWRIRGFKAGVLNAALPHMLTREIAAAAGKEVTSKERQIMRAQLLRVLTNQEGSRESFAVLLEEFHLTMEGIATAVFQSQMPLQLEVDKHADAAHDRRNRAYAELEALQERSRSRVDTPREAQNIQHIEAPGSIVPAHPAEERSDAEPTSESGGRVVDDDPDRP
jgi:hypothetical protein